MNNPTHWILLSLVVTINLCTYMLIDLLQQIVALLIAILRELYGR